MKEDTNDNGTPDGKKRSKVVNWIIGSGVLVLFTFSAGSITIYNFISGMREEHDNGVATRTMAAEEARIVGEQAREAAEFARQGILVDKDQNDRLGELERNSTQLYNFTKELCQGLRDREEGHKWPDCTKI